MSEYDLFKSLSDLDEELILQPRKSVSLRLNCLFCFIAASISGLIPQHRILLNFAVFLFCFYFLYIAATWIMNRKHRRRLLIENASPSPEKLSSFPFR